MNVAARLALAEAAIARLAAAREPRISDMLREARARVLAGEPVPPALHDIAELEAAARGRGVAGELARARLRKLRAEGAYGRQDGRDGVEGTELPAADPTRSTALETASTPTSERDLLLERIDATLARANGHA